MIGKNIIVNYVFSNNAYAEHNFINRKRAVETQFCYFFTGE